MSHSIHLTNSDIQILSTLDEQGGITTGMVAKAIGRVSDRRRATSQLTLQDMKALCSMGLVRRMDDLKPICWVRTPQGTQAIEQHQPRARPKFE